MMKRLVLSTFIVLSFCLVSPLTHAGPYEEALAIVENPQELAKRFKEAKKKFKAATRKNKKNAHAWYNLGLLAHLKNDTKEAERAWKGALKADATYLAAQARLAELELRSGDRAKAKAELEKIIEKNRYQAEARNVLAALAIEAEDWELAQKHARNVLLGDPTNVNGYVNLAMAYYGQDLHEQAWLIASNALERCPNAAALHNILGLVYLIKDDSRSATDSFLTAIKLNPLHLDAKLNLAALELSYGDFSTALKRFDDVLKVRRDDPMLLLSRAVALRGLERYEDAEKGYNAALKKSPNLPAALYNLCVLHHQYTNKWETAKHYCNAYGETIDSTHPKAREIAKRVKSIQITIDTLAAAMAPEENDEQAPKTETETEKPETNK